MIIIVYRHCDHMSRKPTKYTKATAEKILKRLANGETLSSICRDPNMPGKTTVLNWALGFHKIAEQNGFPDRYARARLIGYHGMGDELIDIADDGTNDWMERLDKNGEPAGWKVNNEAVQRSKLRVEARKWLLAKALPKIYGDKQQVDHTSSDGSMQPITKIERVIVDVDPSNKDT